MSKLELDDQILNHDKFVLAVKRLGKYGGDAIFLWLGIRAYCGQRLSDGFIPTEMLDEVRGPLNEKQRAAALKVLVDVRLLDTCDGGFRMHDFLDWSRSKSQVLADRARARERQAMSRRDKHRDIPDDDDGSNGGSHDGSSSHVTKASGSASDLPLDPDSHSAGAHARRDRFMETFETLIPESFPLNNSHYELCRKKNLDVQNELAKHRIWAKQHSRRCLDWPADFEFWLRNAHAQRSGKGPSATPEPIESPMLAELKAAGIGTGRGDLL